MPLQSRFIGVVVVVNAPACEPFLLARRRGRINYPFTGQGIPNPDHFEGTYTVALFGERRNAEHPAKTIERLLEDQVGRRFACKVKVSVVTPLSEGTHLGEPCSFYNLELRDASLLLATERCVGTSLDVIPFRDVSKIKVLEERFPRIVVGEIWMPEAHKAAMIAALDSVVAPV